MPAIFYISYALLWLLVVFESLLLLGLARGVSRPAPQSQSSSKNGLPGGSHPKIGQPVPHFSAIDVLGRQVDEGSLPRSLSALLFVTPNCTTCMASLEEVNALHTKVDGSLVVVCRGGLEDCRYLREAYQLNGVPILVDEDRAVSEAFDVQVTPTAVLVGSTGLIRTYGHPMAKDELARFIEEKTATSSPAELMTSET
jgi:peroxiredoxin